MLRPAPTHTLEMQSYRRCGPGIRECPILAWTLMIRRPPRALQASTEGNCNQREPSVIRPLHELQVLREKALGGDQPSDHLSSGMNQCYRWTEAGAENPGPVSIGGQRGNSDASSFTKVNQSGEAILTEAQLQSLWQVVCEQVNCFHCDHLKGFGFTT